MIYDQLLSPLIMKTFEKLVKDHSSNVTVTSPGEVCGLVWQLRPAAKCGRALGDVGGHFHQTAEDGNHNSNYNPWAASEGGPKYKCSGALFDNKLKFDINPGEMPRFPEEAFYNLFIESIHTFSVIRGYQSLTKQEKKHQNVVSTCSKIMGHHPRSRSIIPNQHTFQKANKILKDPTNILKHSL